MTTKISYALIKEDAYEEERAEFLPGNKALCEKLNDGAKFGIAFMNPLYGEGRSIELDAWQLQYAVVYLNDGNTLPFPLFWHAIGYNTDDDFPETLGILEYMIMKIFGKQFAGCTAVTDGDEEGKLRAKRAAIALANGKTLNDAYVDIFPVS